MKNSAPASASPTGMPTPSPMASVVVLVPVVLVVLFPPEAKLVPDSVGGDVVAEYGLLVGKAVVSLDCDTVSELAPADVLVVT